MLATKNKKLTLEDLINYASNFLINNYDMELNIPIKINKRLKRKLGAYTYQKHTNVSIKIELSYDLVKYGTNNIILDILRHELIHYALHRLGLPHFDGHPYFENELIKHNASATKTKFIGKIEVFQCSECKKELRHKVVNINNLIHKYITACCDSSFIHVGSELYNGENKKVFLNN